MAEARLHHIGFVVRNVEEALPRWSASLSVRSVSAVFHDPLQRVYVAFLEPPAGDAVQVELVAPAGEDSPVASFLAKGGGLHHVCYEVDNLEAQLQEMTNRKALLLRPPKPAVAFEGRRIAWIMTRERLVIEYLERRLS
jgi:methylmalonyl-CoA/ethylmalonyl-CoA epimerase